MKKYIFILLLFICYQGYGQESDFAVRIKLKPQRDTNYLATKDPEIKALVLKHGVELIFLLFPFFYYICDYSLKLKHYCYEK